MKKNILHITLPLLLCSSAVYSAESDILREIKNLREDSNREFKNIHEEIKTLREDMNKRFEQFMWFFALWVPVSLAIVGYILQRSKRHGCLGVGGTMDGTKPTNRHDDRIFEISKKSIEAEDLISAIGRAKPETRKRLREVLKG